MAQEYKVQVKDVEEYETYNLDQLEEVVAEMTAMVNDVRSERQKVEALYKVKSEEAQMENKVAMMTDSERESLRKVMMKMKVYEPLMVATS